MQSVHFGWSIKFSLFIRFTSAALYTQMFFNEVNVIDGNEQMDEKQKNPQHNERSRYLATVFGGDSREKAADIDREWKSFRPQWI